MHQVSTYLTRRRLVITTDEVTVMLDIEIGVYLVNKSVFVAMSLAVEVSAPTFHLPPLALEVGAPDLQTFR